MILLFKFRYPRLNEFQDFLQHRRYTGIGLLFQARLGF